MRQEVVLIVVGSVSDFREHSIARHMGKSTFDKCPDGSIKGFKGFAVDQ